MFRMIVYSLIARLWPLLEEITSNVNEETGELMQSIILKEVPGRTIIAIILRAHILANLEMINVVVVVVVASATNKAVKSLKSIAASAALPWQIYIYI